MGIGGSMLWWEEGFCRMMADGRRFVISYDHRDTGRSVTYEPGHPPDPRAPTWSPMPRACPTPTASRPRHEVGVASGYLLAVGHCGMGTAVHDTSR